MAIQITDTLAGKKQELVTLEPGKVRFYACGPTVYDHAHVGHARSYVVWDVVVRHLRARGYDVKYVRNFTDVDDKIIKRANERGEDPIALAAHYARAYDEDMDALGNLRPDVAPRVSGHVPQIVAMIEALIGKGYAYAAANGDVYYRVRKFPEYGRLSKRNLDDLLSGARVEVGEAKEDPLDFALWKAAKPGEPAWDSPWGKGRPGWHIECSAMTLAHLGVPIDLHGGGKDLVFPHHENELAQSESYSGKTFARYWMHNGLMKMGQSKMAGSIGNVINVVDLLNKHQPETVRFLLLNTHYRSPIEYSEERLVEMRKALEGFYRFFERFERVTGESFFSLAAPSKRAPFASG